MKGGHSQKAGHHSPAFCLSMFLYDHAASGRALLFFSHRMQKACKLAFLVLLRSDYDSMLGELERAGLVRWVDPQNKPQGREVSPAGRAALRRLVESHARTHAHAGGYENAGAGGRGWGGAQ